MEEQGYENINFINIGLLFNQFHVRALSNSTYYILIFTIYMVPCWLFSSLVRRFINVSILNRN